MAPLRSCPWANFLPYPHIGIAARNARLNSAHQCINFYRIVPMHDDALNPHRHSQSADARKFQRWPANIEAQHRAEEIDFKTLDPSDGEAEITSERSKDAGTGSRQPERLALVGIVFSDRGRWQHSHQFGNRVQRGLDECVGVRTRPRAVIAVSAEYI